MDGQFGNLMQQILGLGTDPVPESTRDQFHEAAHAAPADALSRGLAAAFESPQARVLPELRRTPHG